MADQIVLTNVEKKAIVDSITSRTLTYSTINKHVLSTVIDHMLSESIVAINEHRIKEEERLAQETAEAEENDSGDTVGEDQK